MKHYTLSFLLCWLFLPCMAQKKDSARLRYDDLFIGTTLSRTIFHVLASELKGFNADIELKYRLKRVMFNGTIGTSKYYAYRKDIDNRFIIGNYYEVGIEILDTKFDKILQKANETISISLHYLRSSAREEGTLTTGNSFGNYNRPYTRKMSLHGARFALNIWSGLGTEYLYVVLSPKILYTTAPDLAPFNAAPINIPLTYMPGVGIKFISTNANTGWLSLGLDVKLVVRLYP